MLGKKTLLALLVLGLAIYQVAAQDDSKPPGRPNGPDVGTRRPPGAGPPGPPSTGIPSAGPGPRPPHDPRYPPRDPPAPPSRPPPNRPFCATRDTTRVVTRITVHNGRKHTCRVTIPIRGCVGICSSHYFNNPQTLVAEKRCECCQPLQQGVRTYDVSFQCPDGVPDVRFTLEVPVAEKCGCKSC